METANQRFPETLDLISKLSAEGYTIISSFLDPIAAKDLLASVKSTRQFDETLFLTEEEWEASFRGHEKTNPGPGFNALEQFPEKLNFVEKDRALNSLIGELLGPKSIIFSRKLVCRLSWSAIPEWIKRRFYGKPCNSLGAFIKPQYRDLSYYVDVDLHQDVQDIMRIPIENRDFRCVTLYVYLDDVTEDDGPVCLLSGSHRLGATPHQHNVIYDKNNDEWIYTAPNGDSVVSDMVVLTGKAGDAGIWHSCTLHGAPPVKDGHLRISLRYIIGRDPEVINCSLDMINSDIQGSLKLDKDFTPGSRANVDGTWNLYMTDFIRHGYEKFNLKSDG